MRGFELDVQHTVRYLRILADSMEARDGCQAEMYFQEDIEIRPCAKDAEGHHYLNVHVYFPPKNGSEDAEFPRPSECKSAL